MSAVRSPWRRTLWGVEFRNSRGDGHLLGTLWDEGGRERAAYTGEPAHALLFCTRAQARGWCAKRRAAYVDYPKHHICRAWRFCVVRVRESVEILR